MGTDGGDAGAGHHGPESLVVTWNRVLHEVTRGNRMRTSCATGSGTCGTDRAPRHPGYLGVKHVRGGLSTWSSWCST